MQLDTTFVPPSNRTDTNHTHIPARRLSPPESLFAISHSHPTKNECDIDRAEAGLGVVISCEIFNTTIYGIASHRYNGILYVCIDGGREIPLYPELFAWKWATPEERYERSL